MAEINDLLKSIKCIVVGVSAGGFEALNNLILKLTPELPVPLIIVQHRVSDNDSYLSHHLNLICKVEVKEVNDKEPISSGVVYIAPADYHLLIESNFSFSLSRDEKVNYARPSIDVLFESASTRYQQGCLGIILTGKNSDGALGLAEIVRAGGLAIIEDPNTAEATEMPRAAIKQVPSAKVYNLSKIGDYLAQLTST